MNRRSILQKIAFHSQSKAFWLIAVDALLLPFALYSAVLLRLGGDWDHALDPYWWIFVVPLCWVLPIFIKLGLYRAVLKYIDDQIIWTVFLGVSLTVCLLIAMILSVGISAFPRSAIMIFWVFAMAYIGGVRFLLRGLLRRLDGKGAFLKPVLIYGAGKAGLELMQALLSSYEYQPVAFLDDNKLLWGRTYRGLRVYNAKKVKQLAQKTGATTILLAMPSVSLMRQKQIIEELSVFSIPIKRLPGLSDLVSGKVNVQALKTIEINDLLSRDLIPPDPTLLAANIAQKNVLVTGAGGSIGFELCRQIVQAKPSKIILFELSEYALYRVDKALATLAPTIKKEIVLGSILDQKKVQEVLLRHQIDTIYHAAAYKHVPLVEKNPLMGIKNNVIGTDILIQSAIACHVKTFVLISTDKAVCPASVMGATKRLAEMLLVSYQPTTLDTHFMAVRFGNVLDSSGSVVPLFRQQILQGGPLTVTHPKMTRYFMTLSEAAQLVIQAGAMGRGGEIFVLDMGEPVPILNLAKRMISLSGLRLRTSHSSKGDIDITFTGLRPGEKLKEKLWDNETVLTTQHPRILHIQKNRLPKKSFYERLQVLFKACEASNETLALKTLGQLVNTYHPPKGDS